MQNNFHYLFKYIIIGDQSVGKSCLLLQFTQSRYTANYQATLGVQFGSKFFKCRNKIVKAMIWDTAGQETFKSIIRSYYRGAIIALVVYDITKRQSFNHLTKWLQQVHNHSHEFIQIVIVGNKSDLQQSRQIPFSQGKKFADDEGFLFFEVSAKQNKFVFQSFQQPAERIIQKLENKEILFAPGLNIGIKIGNPQNNAIQDQLDDKSEDSEKKLKKKQQKSCTC